MVQIRMDTDLQDDLNLWTAHILIDTALFCKEWGSAGKNPERNKTNKMQSAILRGVRFQAFQEFL